MEVYFFFVQGRQKESKTSVSSSSEAKIRRMIDSEFKDGLFEDSTDNPNRRWVLHADGSVQHVRHGEADEEQSDEEDAAIDAAQD